MIRLAQLRREAADYLDDVEKQVQRLRSEAEARAAAVQVEVQFRLATADALAGEWLAEAEAERDAILRAAAVKAATIIAHAEAAVASRVRPTAVANLHVVRSAADG